MIQSGKKPKLVAVLLVLSTNLVSSCASNPEPKLTAEARKLYLQSDFDAAESKLLQAAVMKRQENRLLHLLSLGSIAMSQKQFAKAVYIFQKARNVSNENRGDWSLFGDPKYSGTPLEFSWIHAYLATAYLEIAESGVEESWSLPEVKDDDDILVPAMEVPKKVLTPSERQATLRQARAEVMAWDSHLQNLSRIFAGSEKYQDDSYARFLGSLVHAKVGGRHDLSIAKSLFLHAERLNPQFTKYKDKASSQSPVVILELGTLPPLKSKKVLIGLSLLFKQIKDPQLRALVERIGIEVILHTAPEFGLVMLGGAIGGAISSAGDDDSSGDDDDEPIFFTTLVDRGLGIQLEFPWMTPADPIDQFEAELTYTTSIKQPSDIQSTGTKLDFTHALSLHQNIYNEYKNAKDDQIFKQAVSVGLKYVTILIPAIQAWRNATNTENEFFKKLAIMGSYMIAKKAIDAAHAPDLRSWSWLPEDILVASPGGKLVDGTYVLKSKWSRFKNNKTEERSSTFQYNANQKLIHLMVR